VGLILTLGALNQSKSPKTFATECKGSEIDKKITEFAEFYSSASFSWMMAIFT